MLSHLLSHPPYYLIFSLRQDQKLLDFRLEPLYDMAPLLQLLIPYGEIDF